MGSKNYVLIASADKQVLSQIQERFEFAEFEIVTSTNKGDIYLKCKNQYFQHVVLVGFAREEVHEMVERLRQNTLEGTKIHLYNEDPLHGLIKHKKWRGVDAFKLPIDYQNLGTILGGKKTLISKEIFNVLIVDDIEMNREVLKEVLDEYNCKLMEAKNGEEAKVAVDQLKFDLVLLDFMMPDINGDKVLEHIRSKWDKDQLPVIIVSAQEEMDNVKKLASQGINGYIVKPIEIESVLDKIQKVIPIKLAAEKT